MSFSAAPLRLLSLGFSLVLAVFTSAVQAQVIPSVGLHSYLTDRVDFSQGNNLNAYELRGRGGWHAGFDVRTSKKMLYLQPGIHYYSTNIAVEEVRETGIPQREATERHTALKIPAMAGLRFGFNKLASVHLQGGPVATVSLQQGLTDDLGGMKNLAFGLAAGAAVDLLSFNVALKYEWGQTQAFLNQPGNADVLTVGIGFVF